MSSFAASAAETGTFATAFFSVQACADPGVMPRVLEMFAKRGLVPSSWRSAVSGSNQARLTIEIAMGGLDREIAEYIASCLRQIASVEFVFTLCRDRGD